MACTLCCVIFALTAALSRASRALQNLCLLKSWLSRPGRTIVDLSMSLSVMLLTLLQATCNLSDAVYPHTWWRLSSCSCPVGLQLRCCLQGHFGEPACSRPGVLPGQGAMHLLRVDGLPTTFLLRGLPRRYYGYFSRFSSSSRRPAIRRWCHEVPRRHAEESNWIAPVYFSRCTYSPRSADQSVLHIRGPHFLHVLTLGTVPYLTLYGLRYVCALSHG